MATTIRDTILADDWNAAEQCRGQGDTATREIVDLLKSDRRGVRNLTVVCLHLAGGPQARSALVDALLDEDPQVRASAVRALHEQPDPALYPRLVQAYDRSPDPHVRGQIPMIVARNDQAITDQTPLTERWAKEEDAVSEEGLVVGLARLGNEEARKRFVERLHSSSGTTRDQYLKHCKFIHQPWLLKPLAPVLADETKLRYIGPHGRDVDLRACDITVNLVAEISNKRFSFPVSGRSNYSSDQRQEVRGYLDSLAESP